MQMNLCIYNYLYTNAESFARKLRLLADAAFLCESLITIRRI